MSGTARAALGSLIGAALAGAAAPFLRPLFSVPQGGIGAVSLPGKAPLQELFRDLPFGPEALGSPSALLNALVGSEIEIAGRFGVNRHTGEISGQVRGPCRRPGKKCHQPGKNAGSQSLHRNSLPLPSDKYPTAL